MKVWESIQGSGGSVMSWLKNKFFTSALLLLGLVLPSLAAESWPLYFDRFSATTKGNAETDSLNQQEWNYLMRFKMFGATGIQFKNQNIIIPDSSGWFGTSKGNFDMTTANGNIVVGGPIIIGGNINFNLGPYVFNSGPVRVEGSINADNGGFHNPYQGTYNEFNGQQCVSNSVSGNYAQYVPADKQHFGAGYGSCPSTFPDSVPHVNKNLRIPSLNNTGMSYNPSININNGYYYIDVPPYDEDSTMYDYYVENISMSNYSHLIVRMPPGGRLTRVFVRGSIHMESHPTIQTMIMENSATFANGTWSGSGKIVNNKDYLGQLMFYTTNDITFPSMNLTDTLQGTFITTGRLEVQHHIVLAGQLLSNYLFIDTDFDGSSFIYVPFDPPEIDIEGLVRNIKFPETDRDTMIPVSLTKVPETNVYIDYCLMVMRDGNGDPLETKDSDGKYLFKAATMDDINWDGTKNKFPMPDCEKNEVRHMVIPSGSKTPISDEYRAWLNVKIDEISEDDEIIVFYVTNISGAVIKGDIRTGGVSLTLMSDKKNSPPQFTGKVNLGVKENDMGAIVGEIAGIIQAEDLDNDNLTFSIIGGNGAEIFEIVNIDKTTGQVSLKDGVSLNYEALTSINYEYNIDVKVVDGKGGYATNTFVVKVENVNEKPIISGVVQDEFNVKENAKNGYNKFGQVKWDDTDSTKNSSGYTHNEFRDNILEAIGGDTAIFAITTNGILSVKYGDSLDYEKDSIYTLLVRVRDRTIDTLWDTTTVTIRVTDVDDVPEIVDTDTTVIIPPPPGGGVPDTIGNIVNKGNVDENNPENAPAGVVVATCSDSTKTLYYSIVKDTSGLFAIDQLTGVVTVKDSMVLDYETVNKYEITVKVSDGLDVGNGKDANGVVVQSDSRAVTIVVNDVNELPIVEPQSFSIVENSGSGAEVGKVDDDDYDNVSKFTRHSYEAVGGDTAIFDVDTRGYITTKTDLDYEKYAATGDTVFTVQVKVKDNQPGPNGEELFVVETMTIVLKDANEAPKIQTDEVSVAENTAGGTPIAEIETVDLDGETETFVYTMIGTSDIVEVSSDGLISVKDGADIDYEKTQSELITVMVTDGGGLTDTKTIKVNIIDVNEPPTMDDQGFEIKENKTAVVGTLVAEDPDKSKKFNTLVFTQITPSNEIKIKRDGTVEVIKKLDYESDSLYTILAEVCDGEFCDTATVTVRVIDVPEKSEVEITRAENRDSVWLMPDSIYVNNYDLNVEWTEDGTLRSGDTTLVEGTNEIIKCYLAPGKDTEGCDTLIVVVSTVPPIVTVTKTVEDSLDPNIFTVVEEVAEGDTSFYVNKEENDIVVTVTDPVSGSKESFTIELNLDTLSIPSKVYGTMADIADAVQPLHEKAKNAVYTPVNDDRIAVSYVENIDGHDVTVTYYTDRDGEIIPSASGLNEMTVSYQTVVGKDTVTVSFQADAETGYAQVNKETGAAYNIQYAYKDSKGNAVDVSYNVSEKGKIVRSEAEEVGFMVSYTYVNKFGNSATKSISVVLDKKPPLVWIKSPIEDEILYSNTVDVEWYVSVTGDSADFVLQDTLVTQGLEKGTNGIPRFYCDKAGNCDSATVYVIMKNAKDVDIYIENPVTEMSLAKTEEYYAANPPEKGETFAVSIKNSKTGKEYETLVGGDFKTKDGTLDTPYPGLEGHLGPTLEILTRVPVVDNISGLATLDDLVGKDGLVSVDGVDAAKSEKLSVEDYVQEYCDEDFRDSLGSDISRANLYNTTMYVKVWVYTTLGSFVDYFSFAQEVNDPDYVNEGGKLDMFFEMKPTTDGFVRAENGHLYATGAYLYKTEVEMRTTLRCTLPPVHDNSKESNKVGFKRKVTEDMLKPFGYKRPISNPTVKSSNAKKSSSGSKSTKTTKTKKKK